MRMLLEGLTSMKQCIACGRNKSISEFNCNAARRDGFMSMCRICASAYQSSYRRTPEFRAYRREYMKKYRKTSKGKVTLVEADEKWKSRNVAAVIAHKKVLNEIRYGRLARPDRCEECGNGGPLVAHHLDYSKPINVEWLCNLCHTARHEKLVVGV